MNTQKFKDGTHVALVHERCIICADKTNESIALSLAGDDISRFHNQTVGFSKCEKCVDAINKGAVMFIVLDQEKTTDINDPQTWYRTGNIFGITKEAVERVLGPDLFAETLRHGFMLIDYREALTLGLPVKYDPQGEPTEK